MSHLQIDLLKIVTSLNFCMNNYTSLAEHNLRLSEFLFFFNFFLYHERIILKNFGLNIWCHRDNVKKCVKVHAYYDNPK